MTRRVPFGLPPIRTASAKLAIGLVLGSLGFAFGLGASVLLIPEWVLTKFALWQFVTYAFVAQDPLGVIFGSLILWSIGGSLEQTWGSRRLVVFALGVCALAGMLTVLTAMLFESLRLIPFAGANVMTGSLWVAFGLSWGSRQTGFWGLPVTGNVLALIGVGFVVLSAAYGSWLMVIPETFALAMTFAYVRLNFPARTLEQFNSWRLRRQLAHRRSHLDVVSGDKRNTPNDSDRFLH